MTFTRRTYRVAIRRSMMREAYLNRAQRNAAFRPMNKWLPSYEKYLRQTARTARLQRRKRRERK